MNAEEFYAEFKAALTFLGPGWAGMEQVQVSIEGTCIIFSTGKLTAKIDLSELQGK